MAHARLVHRGARWGLAASIVAAAACGPPPVVTKPPPPSATPPPPLDFEGGRWGDFRSKRFRILLPLPDGRGWRIDDHKTNWLSATHAATTSELLVRTWQEYERANTKVCEAKARLWNKTLPEREGAEIVEHRAFPVPAEFDTWVDIGVVPAKKPGAEIRAFALAFGGRRHQCFAFVYTTRAEGHGAEQAIASRLATMVQKSLGKVTADDGLNPLFRGGPEIGPAPRPEPGPRPPP